MDIIYFCFYNGFCYIFWELFASITFRGPGFDFHFSEQSMYHIYCFSLLDGFYR